MTKLATSLFQRSVLPVGESFISVRALSVSSKRRDDSESLFSRLLGLQVEKATDAHSKVLTEKETLYEFECKFYLLIY